jgi:hypothetical protein
MSIDPDPIEPLASVALKVSVVINNFNYARFLPACIESVLAQTYPHCEVIVVDDGSKDESPQVIEQYRPKVVPVLKTNGGQASAYRAGLQHVTGNLVLLLDADDYLKPECLARVVSAWRGSVVKAQFYLELVDETGNTLGMCTPSGRMTDRRAREMMQIFGTYSSPPASGNVFSAAYLREIAGHTDDAQLRTNADTVPIRMAPYFGEVITIPQPLACYRRHASAETCANMEKFEEAGELRRLAAERQHEETRDRSIERVFSRLSLTRSANLLEPSRSKRALCFLRLSAAQRGSFSERLSASWNGIRSSFYWDGYKWPQKLSASVWFLAAGLLPYALARDFIAMGLTLKNRPRWMGKFLSGGTRRAQQLTGEALQS